MLGLKRGTVQLREYEPEWGRRAEATIETLGSILGPVASDIQHVGSTAVPAIRSKPIIDIAVAVADFAPVVEKLPQLENAGFWLSRDDRPRELLLVSGSREADTRDHHIHVVAADGPQWRDYILFRDFLNGVPQQARVYEREKIRLAEMHPDDRKSYTAGKEKLIRRLLRHAFAWRWLGRTVDVTVDRPMGSAHPKHPDLIYPVNYGFLAGVPGGDGDDQDAYILGVNEPISAFNGQVIGCVHRSDDVEYKLVVAAEGTRMDQADIAEAIRFQEQFFDSSVDALYQRSFGTIPARREEDGWKYLLLKQRPSGAWSFPKGHREIGETAELTALRETYEETGLFVEILPGFSHRTVYPLWEENASKETTLFLALLYGDQEVETQQEEIFEHRWVTLTEALGLLRPAFRNSLRQAEAFLNRAQE